MSTPCDGMLAYLGARAAGEPLRADAACEGHLASCAACRGRLAGLERAAALLRANPEPADSVRRSRLLSAARARPASRPPLLHRILPYTCAAAVLLVAAVALRIQTETPSAPPPDGEIGSPPPARGEDWRQTFLRQQTGGASIQTPVLPDLPPEREIAGGGESPPGGGSNQGSGGGGTLEPPPGAEAWVPWAGSAVPDDVLRQFPATPWTPANLPKGMTLEAARIARPSPGRVAAVIIFADAGRRIVLFEEAAGVEEPDPPLPLAGGLRSARFKSGRTRILAVGTGFGKRDWELFLSQVLPAE